MEHRRSADLALRWSRHLESLAGLAAVDEWPPAGAVRAAHRDPVSPGGEVLLWRAVQSGDPLADSGIDLAARGPLWRSDAWAAIEVWTEAELCGLHALWRAARLRSDERGPIRNRLSAAIDWHLEHTQPDNATNRPWALHAFLFDPREEGRLYAETLLHNAQAQGLGDDASRWILADAARELRLSAATLDGAAGASGNE
ncbi:MAG: hypothetical protein U0572_13770 [Phycisphaerales bacterium]